MFLNNYLKLVRFSHTIFSLPFAIAAFVMAMDHHDQPLNLKLLLLILLAVVFARNAAMAFNRYADRHFDAANPRTQQREIPSGIVSPRSALWFVIINAILFATVAWFINPLCFALSPIALLVILGYSLTKRFTALCHLVLGAGLALAPLGAWLAVTAAFHLVPGLLALTVLFWVAGFDIIYALQDDAFDHSVKLRSIPSTVGRKRALRISAVLHIVSFISLAAVGVLNQSGTLGWIAIAIFGAALLYQHLIVSANNLSRINIAFFTTNGLASLVWGTLAIVDVLMW
jgi:4-hydroxybenzoate polyprenyltransferase